MRAARVTEHGSPLDIQDRERPNPGPNEVIVEMKSCGVCHSDVGIRRGTLPTTDPPFTMGHEPMGVVAERGDRVTGVSVGSRVSVNPMVTCGECYYCVRGRDDLCERWRAGTDPYGTIGRDRNGGFAEYLRAPAKNLVELPDSVSDAIGSILVDACATSFNSVSTVDFEYGDSTVVYGVGGLGSCAVKYLSQSDHLKLIAVDVNDSALTRAQRLGADRTIDASERDPVATLWEMTERGVDVAFEFTGSPEVMENAVRSVRPAGTVVITGCAEHSWEVPGAKLCLDAVEIVGSHGFTHTQIGTVIQLIDEGTIQFEDILTHEFPLSEVNTAIDILEDPSQIDEEVGRITISFE